LHSFFNFADSVEIIHWRDTPDASSRVIVLTA